MRLRTIPLAASLTTTGLVTALLTVLPGTATAAPSGLSGDFNGDGHRDLAISAPAATVGGKSWAGHVAVAYGSDSGSPDPARRTVISQNSPGVPGEAETDDEFGHRIAAADLNRDGYSDLVVTSSREKVGSHPDAGTVVIVWGSAGGLSGGTTVDNPQPLHGSYFGLGLATGDFTGDGKPDLAVSAQGDTGTNPFKIRLIRGPFTKSGSTGTITSYAAPLEGPTLTAGRVNGDAKADLVVTGRKTNSDHLGAAVYYKGTSAGLTKGASLRAGTTAAIGDLDGDGYGDIAVGNPDEPGDEPSGSKGGEVSVIYGTSSGPSSTRRTTLTQSSAGVPGASEYGDNFGASVAVGDLDGDGHAELTAGAPGESLGAEPDLILGAGAVTVLRGSASGLTTTGALNLTQDSPGVPGSAESIDGFGATLLSSDIGADGRQDLTATASQENDDAGAVWHLPGTAGSLYSTTTSTSFGPSGLGLSTAYSAFGSDLAG
ncbi:VCBS repeat-containing protein [Streptomyces sp. NBC_01381]|uniref:FG-GAP and VCBS repeat-containing protein n=1 Tax=Streptomyces sp. NBC_01381 TaxID=2903845 RepID=UPI002250B6A3|nr:FG-GAP and VCBS repeat-containing protein [Streptomyces sp. NBC_01381]MCX4665616.1 VCBS repeat-containing protein [Streptomyces sp. NBC_01381]